MAYNDPLVDGITPCMRSSATNRKTQRAAKGLEQGFGDVVRVATLQVVDVQGGRRVIDETLKKLANQVDVELADARAQKFNPVLEPGTAGKIDDHARQGFVQRHVGVPVTHNALLVTERLLESLAEGNADVLNAVVIVDVQIAFRFNLEIEATVTGDLLEHVLEERNPGIETGFSAAVEIELDADLRLQRIAADTCFSV